MVAIKHLFHVIVAATPTNVICINSTEHQKQHGYESIRVYINYCTGNSNE